MRSTPKVKDCVLCYSLTLKRKQAASFFFGVLTKLCLLVYILIPCYRCFLVRHLREELQLLQEPGSYVAEVVKLMGKTKVLVKVRFPLVRCLSVYLAHWMTKFTPHGSWIGRSMPFEESRD